MIAPPSPYMRAVALYDAPEAKLKAMAAEAVGAALREALEGVSTLALAEIMDDALPGQGSEEIAEVILGHVERDLRENAAGGLVDAVLAAWKLDLDVPAGDYANPTHTPVKGRGDFVDTALDQLAETSEEKALSTLTQLMHLWGVMDDRFGETHDTPDAAIDTLLAQETRLAPLWFEAYKMAEAMKMAEGLTTHIETSVYRLDDDEVLLASAAVREAVPLVKASRGDMAEVKALRARIEALERQIARAQAALSDE